MNGYSQGNMTDPTSLLEWLVGAAWAVIIAIGGVFAYAFNQIGDTRHDMEEQLQKARTEAIGGDTAIWNSLNEHKTSVAAHREALARELGGVARLEHIQALERNLKTDLDRRDDRLLSQIGQMIRPGNGNGH